MPLIWALTSLWGKKSQILSKSDVNLTKWLVILHGLRGSHSYNPDLTSQPKIRLCKHVWMESYDFKVLTYLLWKFMTKFAPLTFVVWCATYKQGWYTWKRVDTPKSRHAVCLIFGGGYTLKTPNHPLKYL